LLKRVKLSVRPKDTNHTRKWLLKHGYTVVERTVGERYPNYSRTPLPHVGKEIWEKDGERLGRDLSRKMMEDEWIDFPMIEYLAPRNYKRDELRDLLKGNVK
jgi:hypothetical protein